MACAYSAERKHCLNYRRQATPFSLAAPRLVWCSLSAGGEADGFAVAVAALPVPLLLREDVLSLRLLWLRLVLEWLRLEEESLRPGPPVFPFPGACNASASAAGGCAAAALSTDMALPLLLPPDAPPSPLWLPDESDLA